MTKRKLGTMQTGGVQFDRALSDQEVQSVGASLMAKHALSEERSMPFHPRDLSGLVALFDPHDCASYGSDPVTEWAGQAGPVASSSGGSGPHWNPAGIGSGDVVSFGGAGGLLCGDIQETAADYSIYFAIAPTTPGMGIVLDNENGAIRVESFNGGGLQVSSGSFVAVFSGGGSGPIYSVTLGKHGMTARRGGVPMMLSGGGYEQVAWTGFTGIGCDYNGGGDFLEAHVGPLVVFADDHSGNSVRADCEAWIAEVLGL
jgi:hypothetical protein